MPELKDITDEITKTARDAAYVVVGLGVLGIPAGPGPAPGAPEAPRRARSQIQDRLGDVRGEVTRRVKDVDDAVEGSSAASRPPSPPSRTACPMPARDLVKQAHVQAREVRQQLRKLPHARRLKPGASPLNGAAPQLPPHLRIVRAPRQRGARRVRP